MKVKSYYQPLTKIPDLSKIGDTTDLVCLIYSHEFQHPCSLYLHNILPEILYALLSGAFRIIPAPNHAYLLGGTVIGI